MTIQSEPNVLLGNDASWNSCIHFFRIGRRIPLAVFHMIAGVPIFACLFIPETTSMWSVDYNLFGSKFLS